MKLLHQILDLIFGLSIMLVIMSIIGYFAFHIGPKLTNNDRYKKNN